MDNKLTDSQVESLIGHAKNAMRNAYAPYSKFKVGAAILSDSGNIYTGSNVENASYSLSICAERVALFSAVSSGERHFKSLALVTSSAEIQSCCGACLQVFTEFSNPEDPITIILSNLSGEFEIHLLNELFPIPFSSDWEGDVKKGTESK